jgi:hypothetical protein
MGETTQPRTIIAAKPHRCCWCPERIDKGSAHVVYTYFGDDGVNRCRLHPECFEASKRWMEAENEYEWTDNNNTRGCTCEAGDPGHGTYKECTPCQAKA